MVINTNVSAQNGARLLSESSAKLAKSLARLSSGSKIVSPEDDAAGLAVSMRLDAQISRTQAANNNVGNAIYARSGNGIVYNGAVRDIDGLKELPNFVSFVRSYDPSHHFSGLEHGAVINGASG